MKLFMNFFTCFALLGILLVPQTRSQRNTHKYLTLSNTRMRFISQCCTIDNIQNYDFPNILHVRVPGTTKHSEVKEYILSRLNQLNKTHWEITQDTFTSSTPLGPITFTNIIATLNPHKSKRLLLAAHYDSKYFKQGEFLGAIDSALPVALIIDIVLTLDELLHKRDLTDHSLQIIFFDGEEAFDRWTDTDSLYGSRHLAELMEQQDGPYSVEGKTGIEAINAFVLLDLIGSSSPSPVFYDVYPGGSKLFDRLRKIEKRLKHDKLLEDHSKNYFSDKSAHSYYVIQDDHIPFHKRNVPIVHLIPIPFPDQWHKLSDNKDAINWTLVQNFKKILMLFLYEYFHLH